MDCSLPGSSVHGIVQGRILEWVAISFSSGSSWPRNQTWVSCIAGRFFTNWATREAMILAPIKIQWTIHVRVWFWAVNFILLLYVYSYANATLFIVHFEIRKCVFSQFVLFQDCFGCCPWHFNFCKKRFCNRSFQFSSVQSLSRVRLFATPWTATRQTSLSITNSQSPPKPMSIQAYHPLWSPSPPALNLSQHQGLFQWVSSSSQVAQVLEFQLQHQSFQWTPRTDLL